MAILLIGKSVLGELGFCQVPKKMGEAYYSQLEKFKTFLPSDKEVVMTSMTGGETLYLYNNEYVPQIRLYSSELHDMFSPESIYKNCSLGLDKFRPGCDFIVWDSNKYNIVATTFSREAPILVFESSTGMKALGLILRPSLLKFGDYLFQSIQEALCGDITVQLVTCNHFSYPEGPIPRTICHLANEYKMTCIIGEDSEKNPECYHRAEKGNHIVALW